MTGWLRIANQQALRQALERPYLDLAMLGDAYDAPGAAWVAGWQFRNLRIFANLTRATRPGDRRVLALFGYGHGLPLTRLAGDSGRFVVVAPSSVLPDEAPRCR